MEKTIALKDYIVKSMNYETYRKLIDDLFAQGKTTGREQSPERLEYSKLNMARIKRIEQNIPLNEDLTAALKKINKPLYILAITEGWCGDSAQNLPIFSKFDTVNPMIKTLYVLRDENLELMDAYLTNGGRSIPKVIFFDENGNELATWGSRPKECQQVMEEMKAKNATKPEKEAAIHAWYAKDKTQTLQQEISAILHRIS